MEDQKKISVIMSVYNGEKYLHEAIDSILYQTYPNFEFIIIEDASTDKTLEIIERYEKSDPRIKLIKNTVNKGTNGFIENLNIGLKAAKGQFIARMDADDISDLTRFQKQLDFLNANQDIFMVGSSLQLIDKEGKNTRIMSAFCTNEDIQRNMLKNISMYHPVIFFRNDKTIFYREKMHFCEDYDLYLRLMTEGYRFANFTENLLKYRILDDSISRKGNKIIRWLFVEKAREFFQERQNYGHDSYDIFNPQNYLNILDLNFTNTLDELFLATDIALRYKDFESLKNISRKGITHFPNEKMFKIYLKTPKLILRILSKFLK